MLTVCEHDTACVRAQLQLHCIPDLPMHLDPSSNDDDDVRQYEANPCGDGHCRDMS